MAVGLAGGMVEGTQQLMPNGGMFKMGGPKAKPTIDSLPDKVLLKIFSYLSHLEIVHNGLVCKKWHMIAQDPRLWTFVSLRPEISGLHVEKVDVLLKLINARFKELRYLELTTELITPQVHCESLKYSRLRLRGRRLIETAAY